MTAYTPEQVSRIDRLIRSAGVSVIYIVASDADGPVKIGKSTFLTSRLDGLQTGNPFKLHVFGVFLTSRSMAHVIESRIQAALCGARLKGEWFSITALEARSSCRTTIRNLTSTNPSEERTGQSGTDAGKTTKPTSHTALKVIYKKRIAEWSRNVPSCPANRSRNPAVLK
ncbi:GIY-YIG nuclease family protein [Mesorhizobium sp. M1380]|uniref:GIY-YIG nuclease family protein n=1 Tax=Mesorhizobium sp. M1380 TaxID=2957093 RepID=UPI00333D2106